MKNNMKIFAGISAALLLASCGGNNKIEADPLNVATKVADFSSEVKDFYASSGYGNGSPFNVEWDRGEASIKNGELHLSIHKNAEGKQYPYKAGEYRSKQFYGYGDFAARMKPSNKSGTASTFFTYTGEWDSEKKHPSTGVDDTRNPGNDEGVHDEIDIEFLGGKTTKVQFNYFTSGVGGHEYMYDLGFDASLEYHDYGFRWEKDKITWFVDNVPVYRATKDIPSHPGRIIANYWTGDEKAKEWMGTYEDKDLKDATYKWFAATAEPKSTHMTPADPEPVEPVDPSSWGDIDPVDLTLLNADSEYTVAVASDKKSAEITYSALAKETYRNVIFDVPAAYRNSDRLQFELENKGTKAMQVRVDVNAATAHGEHDITAINTSATFDGNSVYTDTSWGGTKVDLAAGQKGVLEVAYDGVPVNVMLMVDSAIYQDAADTHAGDLLVKNLKFRATEADPAQSSGSQDPTSSSSASDPASDPATSESSSDPATSDSNSDPATSDSSEASGWDAINAADLTLLNADSEYTVTVASDKKSAEVTYSAVAKESYKNFIFEVPESLRNSDCLHLELENKGASKMQVRVDVNAATTHGEHDITAINTSATFDGDSVYTDTSWGGTKVDLAAGQKGVLEVAYNGTPVNVMFMVDSAIYQDSVATHAGDLLIKNLKFRAAEANPEQGSSSGEDTPAAYTLNLSGEGYVCNNEAGKSTVTYESIKDNTYLSVSTALTDVPAEANQFAMDVENKGAESVQLNIDLGTKVDGGVANRSVKLDNSGYDWFDESNKRVQYTVGAGQKRTLKIDFDQSKGAVDFLLIFINSCWAQETATHTNGNIEITSVAFSIVA